MAWPAVAGAAVAAGALAASAALWPAVCERQTSCAGQLAAYLDAALPRSMPYHNQGDPRWGGLAYAGGTLTSKGCGLCCASMALSWWSREEVTPDGLLAAVGESCLTGGLNDMAKFGDAMGAWGVARSGAYYDIGEAVAEARRGRVVFCSVAGRLGARSYGGHIVLLFSPDGSALSLMDPACRENTREWSEAELLSVGGWKYFYSTWKEG